MLCRFKAFLFSIIAALLICVNTFPVFCSPLETLEKDQIPLPIIMYHNVSNNRKLLNKFVISVEEFEEDLKYLQANGYETIVMADLIAYVYDGDPLPKKPVILTFDDGDFGIAEYVYPLLEKYDMKAVVSIIGKVTDDYSNDGRTDVKRYPNLTWNEIVKLVDSGRIEIQNHTYNLHQKRGARKIKSESEDAYKERLTKDLVTLQDRMTEELEAPATTFAYPYGGISKSTDAILQEIGFDATLSCREQVNKISYGDKEGLYRLGRFIRPHGISSETFFNKICKTIK